ncbi:MAG: hypothetical protein ACR2MG_10220 [Pyrinomonadaceae bacterium]
MEVLFFVREDAAERKISKQNRKRQRVWKDYFLALKTLASSERK